MKNKDKTGDLYKLLFSDGKSYIGASLGGAWARYGDHRHKAYGGSNTPIHKAWRDLGAPRLIILATGILLKDLWVAEKKAVELYKTKVPYGYNSYPGNTSPPGGTGKIQGKELRERQRQLMKGNKLASREHTTEEKIRRSQTLLKKYHKTPVSKETREKIRQNAINHYKNPEERRKLAVSKYGNKHALGATRSEATRKKMSKSKKALYRDRPEILKLFTGRPRKPIEEYEREATRTKSGCLLYPRAVNCVARKLFMRRHGPIPKGLEVCHTCDNPACIEDSHHFLGTHLENMMDASKKGKWRGGREIVSNHAV